MLLLLLSHLPQYYYLKADNLARSDICIFTNAYSKLCPKNTEFYQKNAGFAFLKSLYAIENIISSFIGKILQN